MGMVSPAQAVVLQLLLVGLYDGFLHLHPNQQSSPSRDQTAKKVISRQTFGSNLNCMMNSFNEATSPPAGFSSSLKTLFFSKYDTRMDYLFIFQPLTIVLSNYRLNYTNRKKHVLLRLIVPCARTRARARTYGA